MNEWMNECVRNEWFEEKNGCTTFHIGGLHTTNARKIPTRELAGGVSKWKEKHSGNFYLNDTFCCCMHLMHFFENHRESQRMNRMWREPYKMKLRHACMYVCVCLLCTWLLCKLLVMQSYKFSCVVSYSVILLTLFLLLISSPACISFLHLISLWPLFFQSGRIITRGDTYEATY